MNQESTPAPFETRPAVRSREAALDWVKEKLTPLVEAGVIAESVRESGQVEVQHELHAVDFSEHPEAAPVAGAQLVLGRLKDLLEQARAEGIMPHEERYLGLCIGYLEGVEQETRSVADILALEEKVPGMLELAGTLEQARSAVFSLSEQAANDDFPHDQAA